MGRRTRRGFTLYELLVTVLVIGVIVSFGVPNLLEFSRNNRMAGTANDFVSAVLLARSESVAGRVPVTLCASPDPVADAPVCDADASDPETQSGYVVWVDPDGDAVIDNGEQLLLQQDDPEMISVVRDNGYLHFS